jgi:type III restriction enzyme
MALKMRRLRQWCEDVNRAQAEVRYDFVYVDEFQKYKPTTFAVLVASFREHKDEPPRSGDATK